MRDRRWREDAAGDEQVAVAAEGERAGRAVGLAPEVGVERDEAVGIVVERGAVRTAAADEIPERALGRRLEGGAVTIATVDMEERVGGERAELAELDRLANKLATECVVDVEVRVRVVADVDLAGGEARGVVGADLEATIVNIDRTVAEAKPERGIRRDADGATIDADRTDQVVTCILQPERRLVDQAGLDEAVVTGIHPGQQARGDEVAVAEEHHSVAAGEVGVALQGRDAARGEEARVVAVAEGDATGEGVVADRHDRAGGIGRARSATGAGNFARDRQAGHRRRGRALDDERAAAEAGVTRITHAEDTDCRRAEAELAGVGDDEITAADGDIAGEGITVIRKHQRAVAGLEEAADAGQQRGDRRAIARVDGDRRRRRAGRRSQRQRVTVERERPRGDAREDQSTDREARAQCNGSTRTDEIRDVLVGIRPCDIVGAIEPLQIGRTPGSRATESSSGRGIVTGGVRIEVPCEVGGLGGGRERAADGNERRGHHQGGARKGGARRGRHGSSF